MLFGIIKHLLDRASPDIQFVVCKLRLMLDSASLCPRSASLCKTKRMSDSALSNKCINIMYTEISMPLLYISMVSGELLYIYRNSRAIAVYINDEQRAPLYYIYRNPRAIVVYINGERGAPLYYILKSSCHCCIHQWREESSSIL